jgi:hypothetical protein
MRRYYALLLSRDGHARLVKVRGEETVLKEQPFEWKQNNDPHAFELTVEGNRIQGAIDGVALFDLVDSDRPLENGAIGLVIEEGRLGISPVRVSPVS